MGTCAAQKVDEVEEKLQRFHIAFDKTGLNLPENLFIEKKPVILYYSGSFCPIHAGHIELLMKAEDYFISSSKHYLVGVYLSASSLKHSRLKMPSTIIGHSHRINMIHLAIGSTNRSWKFDFMEVNLGSTVMLTTLLRFRERILQNVHIPELVIYRLAGGDHGPLQAEISSESKFQDICIINRTSSKLEIWREHSRINKDCILIELDQSKERSSTRIRDFAIKGNFEEVKESVGIPCVSDYIINNSLYTKPTQVLYKIPVVEKCLNEIMIGSYESSNFQLDKAGISYLLMLAGILNKGEAVTSFNQFEIGYNLGSRSRVWRLSNIILDSTDHSIKNDLILKIQSPWIDQELIVSECYFLTEVGNNEADIKVPKAYLAVATPDDWNFLILDFIKDSNFSFWYTNSKEDEIYCFINKLSLFHANWWNHSLVVNNPNIPELLSSSKKGQYFSKFEEFQSDTLKKCFEDHSDWFNEKYPNFTSTLTGLEKLCYNKCICHCDLFPMNYFIDSSNELHIIDWQTIAKASGVADICLFLFTNTNIDYLKVNLFVLLKFYYLSLCKYGVIYYSEDDFIEEVNAAVLFTFIINSNHCYSEIYIKRVRFLLELMKVGVLISDIFN